MIGSRRRVGDRWDAEEASGRTRGANLKTKPNGRYTTGELAKVKQREHMCRKSNYTILARTEPAETNKSQKCYTSQRKPGKYFSKETTSVESLCHQRINSSRWIQRQVFGETFSKSHMNASARGDRSPCQTRWAASKEPRLLLRASTGRTCNPPRQASRWSKTVWTFSSGYSHEAIVMTTAAKASRQPQYVSEQDKNKKRPRPQTSKREKLPDTD